MMLSDILELTTKAKKTFQNLLNQSIIYIERELIQLEIDIATKNLTSKRPNAKFL